MLKRLGTSVLDGNTISEVLGYNINYDNVTGFLKYVDFYDKI